MAGLLAAAAVLLAYAYGGSFTAFPLILTLFVGAAVAVRSGLAPASATRRTGAHRGHEYAPRRGPGTEAEAAALSDATTVTHRRNPQRQSAQLVRLEAEILAGLRERRIYQASVRPQLFDLGMSLLALQKRDDAASLRSVVGEDLWPLIDPALTVDAGMPQIDVRALRNLLTKLEGIA